MLIESIHFENDKVYFNLENGDSIDYQELFLRMRSGIKFKTKE